MASQLRYRVGDSSIMELVVGDITRETTDAIVNAANSSLLGGGGVDGAIHRAAGPRLLEECKRIRQQRGSLPSGKAVSTTGGFLRARYVIHTVGPVWQGGKYNEPQILESCYSNSVAEAERLGCSSMSFPAISTGAYRYPIEQAAQIALRTIAGLLLEQRSVREVHFVLFDEPDFQVYAGALSAVIERFPQFHIRPEPSNP